MRGGSDEDEEMNEEVILSLVPLPSALDHYEQGQTRYRTFPLLSLSWTRAFWVQILGLYWVYSIEGAAGLLMVLGGQAISTRWV